MRKRKEKKLGLMPNRAELLLDGSKGRYHGLAQSIIVKFHATHEHPSPDSMYIVPAPGPEG